jgi:hypothetical protein
MTASFARRRSLDHDAQPLAGRAQRLLHLVLGVTFGEDEAQVAVALGQRADTLAACPAAEMAAASIGPGSREGVRDWKTAVAAAIPEANTAQAQSAPSSAASSRSASS